MRLELFEARLSEEDLVRLKEEAWEKVKPDLGLSPERQLEVCKDRILQQWFDQQEKR